MPKRNDESSTPPTGSLPRGAPRADPLVPERERAIRQILQSLGVRTEHGASLNELREFGRARAAAAVLVDEFGPGAVALLDRPLEDYGGRSVRELVELHGVRALEAIRSDIEYPTPA